MTSALTVQLIFDIVINLKTMISLILGVGLMKRSVPNAYVGRDKASYKARDWFADSYAALWLG
jgi:hypothetical protein